MRFASGFVLLVAMVPLVAGLISGCGDKFEGCQASRSCAPIGGAGSGGADGTAGRSASGGRAGKGGRDSSAGEGGEGGAEAPRAGSGNAGAGDAGEAGTSGDAGGEGGSGPAPDTTAPTIVDVSPIEGQRGVESDAPIVITFSEPMNRVSVELAYQSVQVPLSAASREWSENDTVWTLTPNDPLDYAEGDLDIDALRFEVLMSDTATDLVGNRLEEKTWSFSTLRRITQLLTTSAGDARMVDSLDNWACQNGASLGANSLDRKRSIVAQFALGPVAPLVREWERAELTVRRLPTSDNGEPFSWGVVRVHEFDADIVTFTPDTPVGPDLGVFISDVADEPNLDLLGIVPANYDGDGLVQVWMTFDGTSSTTPDADWLSVACAHNLELRYTAP